MPRPPNGPPRGPTPPCIGVSALTSAVLPRCTRHVPTRIAAPKLTAISTYAHCFLARPHAVDALLSPNVKRRSALEVSVEAALLLHCDCDVSQQRTAAGGAGHLRGESTSKIRYYATLEAAIC